VTKKKPTEPKEVVAIVTTGKTGHTISDQDLYALYAAFHRKVTIRRDEDGSVIIYSIHDQEQDRLLALLPFMSAFTQRRIVINEETMLKLRERENA